MQLGLLPETTVIGDWGLLMLLHMSMVNLAAAPFGLGFTYLEWTSNNRRVIIYPQMLCYANE